MKEERLIYTRREFLQGTLIASLGLAAIPSFLTSTVSAATQRGMTLPGFKDDRILVVVQLGGGCDGLNAMVPHGDDAYHRMRPGMKLGKEKLLAIDDYLAMNARMAPLKGLYDGGGLAIINGVGYPNPNRSHFRSMEIWQTAVDSNRFSKTGWIGRYFDNCCAGTPPAVAGVNVGGDMPQAFAGERGIGVSFQRPDDFRWQEGKTGNSRAAFDAMNHVGSPHSESGDTLDFLRHTTANAVLSSDSVVKAGKTSRTAVEYPNSRLATSLRTIATLIAGGLPTRIYYTSMSGFDTHANQEGTLDNLLGQFSGSLTAFLADLKSIGAADRVMVMCFSEFGRRVEENASRGTDHGTAGPMYLAGAGIKPGLHSRYPSLIDLDEGDLKHTIDFRSVYTDVITGWLGAAPGAVMNGEFARAGVVGT